MRACLMRHPLGIRQAKPPQIELAALGPAARPGRPSLAAKGSSAARTSRKRAASATASQLRHRRTQRTVYQVRIERTLLSVASRWTGSGIPCSVLHRGRRELQSRAAARRAGRSAFDPAGRATVCRLPVGRQVRHGRQSGCNQNDTHPEAYPPLVMFAGVRPDAAPVVSEISHPAPAAHRDARVGKAA